MTTVRVLEFESGGHFFPRNKGLPTDLALELAAAAGVVVNIFVGGGTPQRGHTVSVGPSAACLCEV